MRLQRPRIGPAPIRPFVDCGLFAILHVRNQYAIRHWYL